MLTALDKVRLSLPAMQLLFLEGSLNLRQPIGDWPEDIPFLLIMEKELLQMRASVLQ